MDYKSWFSKSEPFSDIVIDNLSKEYIENLEQSGKIPKNFKTRTYVFDEKTPVHPVSESRGGVA